MSTKKAEGHGAVGEPGYREVLDFWFGQPADPCAITDAMTQRWFGKSDATDREIRERFGALVEKAGRGELRSWRELAAGRLALLILLDQFSRNQWRGSGEMYQYDHVALKLAREMVDSGDYRELLPSQRAFVFLPLEHAEDLALQHEAEALFRELAESVPPHYRGPYDSMVDYAVKHREVIERFGRFPHRNALLGRASTEEEETYLAQPGAGF